MSRDLLLEENILLGTPAEAPSLDTFLVVRAEGEDLTAYRRLRRSVFVTEQGLFAGSDADDVDDDPRTVVLVARTPSGEVLGGVRIHPMTELSGGRDIGWWRGSRLAVQRDARMLLGVGAALIRAACAAAESAGALRFDACVQAPNETLFRRLGWTSREQLHLHGTPHVLVEWPVGRIQALADRTKSMLGQLVGDLVVHDAFLGDDAAPVPGSDLVAATDAILPSMVERDPEWAGWCSVLVNLNDLSAMGASPVGILDAVGARDASFARRILHGVSDAARAWGVPVLGGHTQVGVPAALAVTALGRTAPGLPGPVPGGGGRAGQTLRVTADLGGGWRSGYHGAQWDSSSQRTGTELRQLADVVPTLRPSAAKDVSMSGLVGTVGMLAEASGCGAVLDVAAIPAPADARTADWLTCFPGFAMITAHPGRAASATLPGFVTSAVSGELTAGSGVHLLWPDGVTTQAISSAVTGLGPAASLTTKELR